jgi:spore coat polysaccharide biosynthesis protein SpsF (cytidylyltransferase family)
MNTHFFIQARMSSQRFPGKILRPLNNKPLIQWVVDAVRQAVPSENVSVLTSTDLTDDPLAAYLTQAAIPYFRGPLHNVFERFQLAAKQQSTHWIGRISGDSPLLDPKIIRYMLNHLNPDYDLITNTFPRTFPKGQSVEIIQRTCLLAAGAETADDQEHVTPLFYRHTDQYRILNIVNPWQWPTQEMCVDTEEDLKRLSQMTEVRI